MSIKHLQRRLEATRIALKMNRRRRRRGMNLLEVVIVIAIILIIVGVLGVGAVQIFGQSKYAATKIEIQGLGQNVTSQMLLMGTKPSSLKDISGIKESQLKDAWNNEYVLEVPGPDGADFDIVSYGADGTEGGTGEDADIRLSEL